jgi:hypothetical protein
LSAIQNGEIQQWLAADAQIACLSCKAILWRRFERAADAQRSMPSLHLRDDVYSPA